MLKYDMGKTGLEIWHFDRGLLNWYKRHTIHTGLKLVGSLLLIWLNLNHSMGN